MDRPDEGIEFRARRADVSAPVSDAQRKGKATSTTFVAM